MPGRDERARLAGRDVVELLGDGRQAARVAEQRQSAVAPRRDPAVAGERKYLPLSGHLVDENAVVSVRARLDEHIAAGAQETVGANVREVGVKDHPPARRGACRGGCDDRAAQRAGQHHHPHQTVKRPQVEGVGADAHES